MLYQLPIGTALVLILLDLVLIALSYGSSRIRTVIFRRGCYIVLLLLFGAGLLVKSAGISPGAIASSPNELSFQSTGPIGTFYLARVISDGYLIFWKENTESDDRTLVIEMEGVYPDRLRILKEIDGQFKELRPNLPSFGDTYEPIRLDVSDSKFIELTSEGEESLKQIWKWNLANYLSTFISTLFIISFIWLTIVRKR